VRIRAYLSVLSEPPLPVLLTVSLVAWLLLLQNGHSMHASVHSEHYAVDRVGTHALAQLGWSWLIMLVAMMTPLLAEPIRQLWARSLPRRRLMAIFFFAIAYVAIWMLAGFILSEIAKQLQTLSDNSWLTTPGLALLIAIVWQASPWKQVCLNYCHWKPRLSPFGLAADWDCFRFGAVKGVWCVGSCWALMFLPLVFVHASHLLMLVTGLILLAERYQPARPARWQIPFFGRILN
jgi:predicted metal-binding membrane protein